MNIQHKPRLALASAIVGLAIAASLPASAQTTLLFEDWQTAGMANADISGAVNAPLTGWAGFGLNNSNPTMLLTPSGGNVIRDQGGFGGTYGAATNAGSATRVRSSNGAMLNEAPLQLAALGATSVTFSFDLKKVTVNYYHVVEFSNNIGFLDTGATGGVNNKVVLLDTLFTPTGGTVGLWEAKTYTLTNGTNAVNFTNASYFRIRKIYPNTPATGNGGANNTNHTYDNLRITAVLPPAITGAATATAFTTTYGSASAAQTFPIGGTNLTASITATAPGGFEVSKDGAIYASTATFPQTGGTASGTLWVRLAATAPVSGTYDGQAIVLSSTGAASVNITTAASGNGVTAKALTVAATGPIKPFGTALTAGTSTTDFIATGLVNGETVTGVTLTPDAAGLAADTAMGLPYSVTPSDATGAGGFLTSNYAFTYNAYNGTVGSSNLSVTNSPQTYNGSPQAATVTNPVPGIVSNVMYGGSATVPTNAGTYAVTADFAPTDTVAYSPLTGAAAGNFVILPQVLTAAPPAIAAKDYDATPTAGAVTVGTLTGLIGAETLTVTGAAANYPSANAGSYPGVVVTYTLTDGTGLAANYSLANGAATGVVNQVALAITAPTIADKTYNASATAGAVTVGTLSGFVGIETVTATGAAAAYSSADVGTYTGVVVTYTLGNGTNGGLAANYSLAAGTADGVISPKALTITATGPAKAYGTALTDGPSATNFNAGATGVGTQTVTGVTLTHDTAGLTDTTPVGSSYVVTPSLATGSNGFLESNYNITYNPYDGTVAKKALSITAPALAAKDYDASNTAGVLTIGTLSGFVGAETVTATGGAANYSSANAGSYPAVAITYTLADGDNGGLAANYSLANGSATGVVNKVALSITAPTIADKPYDTTTAAGAVTVGTLSGLVGAETVIASGTAAAYSSANVGSYPDTVVTYTLANGTNGGLAINYSLANGAATGVINKADQTISFTLASPVLLSAGTVSLSATSTSGLTVTFASSNATIADVAGSTLNLNEGGTITVTASQAGDSNYNAATDVPQSLTITDDSTPPTLAIVRVVSAATYNSGTDTTSVTVEFTGEPAKTYQIVYSTNLMTWSTPSGFPTGTGTFQATFTSPGDVAAAWATRMFFRASR